MLYQKKSFYSENIMQFFQNKENNSTYIQLEEILDQFYDLNSPIYPLDNKQNFDDDINFDYLSHLEVVGKSQIKKENKEEITLNIVKNNSDEKI